MAEADFLTVLSWLCGAYGLGWCAGFLLYAFRRVADFL